MSPSWTRSAAARHPLKPGYEPDGEREAAPIVVLKSIPLKGGVRNLGIKVFLVCLDALSR